MEGSFGAGESSRLLSIPIVSENSPLMISHRLIHYVVMKHSILTDHRKSMVICSFFSHRIDGSVCEA